MGLAEQAARRVELARTIGAEPKHWLATPTVYSALVEQAEPDAWTASGQLFHGLAIALGQPRSEWGLDLVLGPRAL